MPVFANLVLHAAEPSSADVANPYSRLEQENKKGGKKTVHPVRVYSSPQALEKRKTKKQKNEPPVSPPPADRRRGAASHPAGLPAPHAAGE